MRYIYEGKDVQWSNVANILSALGLELYAGSYREAESALLLPETLESAAAFERLARSVLSEGKAQAELLEINFRLLRKARRRKKKLGSKTLGKRPKRSR